MGRYALCTTKGAPVGEGHAVQAKGSPVEYVDNFSPGTRDVWLRPTEARGSGVRMIANATLHHYGLRWAYRP